MGTWDQILNLKMVIEKNREYGKNIYLCFIDYRKAFDVVSHELLWKGMLEMGFSSHIVDLIKSLYTDQSASVRTTHRLAVDFRIEQGVTNLRYADDIMLVGGSMEELQDIVNRVHEASSQAGLYLNTIQLRL